MTPVRRSGRGAAGPRYLRPDGNRKLRRRRRTRAALRVGLWMAAFLGAAVLASAVVAGVWKVMTDPEKFPLETILVEGGPGPVRGEIAASLGPLRGRNLFSLDLDQAEKVVRSHRWVSAASIHRRLPGTLLVVVAPRRVEALFESNGAIRMAGSGGRDLGPYDPVWSAESHPVVTGLGAATGGELAVKLRRALGALDELRAVSPGFVDAISEMDVGRLDRLTVTLRDFAPPIFLNPARPARNLGRLPSVRTRLVAEHVDVEYLDLRFKNRVVALPARGQAGDDAA